METLQLPARLGVLHGLEVGYIEMTPGHIPVTSFSPAARRPAHATTLGKALLAFAPADVLRRVGTASLPGFTARTLTRPDQLHHVRYDGSVIDRGELNAHVRTVAAHGLTRELHPSWRRNARAHHTPSGAVEQESAG